MINNVDFNGKMYFIYQNTFISFSYSYRWL